MDPRQNPPIFCLPANVMANWLRDLGRSDLRRLGITSKRALAITSFWTLSIASDFWKLNKFIGMYQTSLLDPNCADLHLQDNPRHRGPIVQHNPARFNPLSTLPSEVLGIIMKNIRIRSLLRLSYTSRLYRAEVLRYFTGKIWKLLLTFHLPPLDFLRILEATRSVIGGSLPFHLLTENTFESNNIDVYTPASQEETMLYLLGQYTVYTPSTLFQSPDIHNSDHSVKYIHCFKATGKILNLRIIPGENAALPIFTAPGSCLMNFVSSRGIYCGHPKLTLCLRSLTIRSRFTNRESELAFLHKYSQRSMSLSQNIHYWPEYRSHRCRTSSVCPQRMRDIYDAEGLFIRFTDATGTSPLFSDTLRIDNRHTVVWNLGRCSVETGPYTRAFAHSELIN
ncbi:hypothetical protein C8R43DRAFT_946855 [Mycena crocata]|nr:hypothetical protein C8R43DRAFT_946855 [Mycena crocata]